MKHNKIDIDLLNTAGTDYLADKQWEQASVCFERLLAHIPNYFKQNPWYQRYLLDCEPPTNCSPEYVANIYAALSLCRMNRGYFADGMQLGRAALRLWPECEKAHKIISQLTNQYSKSKIKPLPVTGDAKNHSGMHKKNGFEKLSILVTTNFTKKLKYYRELSPPSLGLVKATYGSMLQSEYPNEDIPLLQTVSHSNTPHICRVSTIRNKWLPICKSDPACEEVRLRGKAFGIEDPLFKKHMAEVRCWGFPDAHRRWGTYIYGTYNEPAKVAHLGE